MYIVPTDPVPYALFIARHLMVRVDPTTPERRGVTETELPILGDRWFWADDKAKVLSCLAVPELLPRFAAEIGAGFDVLASLCRGSFVLRRSGHPRRHRWRREGRGRLAVASFSAKHPASAIVQPKVGLRTAGRTDSTFLAPERRVRAAALDEMVANTRSREP